MTSGSSARSDAQPLRLFDSDEAGDASDLGNDLAAMLVEISAAATAPEPIYQHHDFYDLHTIIQMDQHPHYACGCSPMTRFRPIVQGSFEHVDAV